MPSRNPSSPNASASRLPTSFAVPRNENAMFTHVEHSPTCPLPSFSRFVRYNRRNARTSSIDER